MLLCGSQHHCVDNFTFENISLELLAFGRECSGLFTGGTYGLWPIACYRIQWDTTVSCEGKIQVGPSILPLICWEDQEDGNKRSSCWDPRARSCHSKKSWLNHFGLINKFVLPLESIAVVTTVTVEQLSSSTEQQCLTTHHYWRSMTELQTTLDPWWWLSPSCFIWRLLASISYVFYCPYFLPHLPEWLGFVINWSNQHLNRCFLNLTSGIHISKNLLSLL